MKTTLKRVISLLLLSVLAVLTLALTSCGSLKLESFTVRKASVDDYEVGDVADFSGLQIQLKYSDASHDTVIGLTDVVLYYEGEELTDQNIGRITETAGEKKLRAVYSDPITEKEYSVEFTVTVTAAIVPHFTKMEIVEDTVPAFYIGDTPNFSGVRVKVYYENTDDIEVGAEALTFDFDEELTKTAGKGTVTVKYNDDIAKEGEKTLDFDVEVKTPTFKALTLDGQPAPECLIGALVDLSTLRATLTYNEGDAYTKVYEYAALEVGTLDTASAGEKTVTVKVTDAYGAEHSGSFTVTVKNPTFSALEVVANSYDAECGVGDTLDFSGLLVDVKYVESAFNKRLTAADFTLSDTSALTAQEGTKSVTVTYTEPYTNTAKTVDFSVEVVLSFLSFTVDESSVTTTYYQEDTYDFSTLVAKIRYNNTAYDLDLTEADGLTVSVPTGLTDTVGEKTVTVTYADPKFEGAVRTATLKVTVAAQGFKSLTVNDSSVKKEYNVNDTIDLSGLTFTVDYENDAQDDTFEYSDSRITVQTVLTDLCASAGQKTIEFKYTDEWGTETTKTLTVTVKAPVYQSAVITGLSATAKLKETYSSTGLTVTVTYDNATVSGTLTAEQYTVTGLTDVTATAGEKTVTVTFKDFNGVTRNASFKVTVTAPAYDGANTTVNLGGAKTEYYVNKTADDFASLISIDVKYDDASYNETLSADKLTVDTTALDLTKAGTYTVTVTFTDPALGQTRTKLITVTVKNPTLTKAEASADKTTYKVGAAVDVSGLKVTLIYDDTSYNTVLTTGFTYSLTGLTSAPGNKSLKITYTDPYTGATADAYLSLSVVGGTVTTFDTPDNFNASKTAREAAGTAAYGEERFEGQFATNAGAFGKYYVGDDNDFIFLPDYVLEDAEGNQLTDILTLAPSVKIGSKDLTKKSGTAANTVDFFDGETKIVTANVKTGAFKFTADALGMDVTLSVLPDEVYDYGTSIKAVTITVTVIDAYNVYKASDLCVMDNSGSTNHGSEDKPFNWGTFKTANGYEGIAPKGIVFQDNITLLPGDFSSDAFFVSKKEVSYHDKVTGKDITIPAGSNFLVDGVELYIHLVADGENFRIEGNYYTLNASKIPTVPSTGMKFAFDESGADYGDDFSNSSLFRFRGTDTADHSNKGTVTMNCLNMIGNANRNENQDTDENLIGVGGLILEKTTMCTLNVQNCLTRAFFISYFPDEAGRSTEAYPSPISQTNLIDSKVFDSFQNAGYVWGNARLTFTRSYAQRAGGPLVILQHVHPEETPTTRIPSMEADDASVLESFVEGGELWFAAVGANDYVAMFKAMDGVIGNGGYQLGSILQNGKMNMIAVAVRQGTNPAEMIGSIISRAEVVMPDTTMSRMYDQNMLAGVVKQVMDNASPNFTAVFNVGDTETGAPTVMYLDADYHLHVAVDPGQAELTSYAGMASIYAAYGASGHLAVNYGGFGIMFGFYH